MKTWFEGVTLSHVTQKDGNTTVVLNAPSSLKSTKIMANYRSQLRLAVASVLTIDEYENLDIQINHDQSELIAADSQTAT